MELHGFKAIKNITLARRWLACLVVMGLLLSGLFLHEARQLSHQIEQANRQVAHSNVRVAVLEAWVRAQTVFPQAGLTVDEAQAFNQTFPPKPDSTWLEAGNQRNE